VKRLTLACVLATMLLLTLACAGGASALPGNLITDPGRQLLDCEDIGAWTALAGALALDAANHSEGQGSIALTTGSAGTAVARAPIAHDMSAPGVFRLWAYLHTPTASVQSLGLRFSPAADFSRGFSWERSEGLYHLHPGWNLLCLSKSEFESSPGATWAAPMIRVEIRVTAAAGETARVSFDDLRCGVLSTPAIVIGFDDGRDFTYDNAYPIMAARGLKGTAYVCSSLVGNPGWMTLGQLQALYDRGWDIANHTRSHPQLTALDQGAIEDEVSDCATYLETHGMPRAARHVAYPYGPCNEAVLRAMEASGMLSGRTGTPRPQALPIDEPYQITDGYTSGAQVSWITDQIDRAVARGSTLHLAFHKVSGSTSTGTTTSIADFVAICDYIARLGLPSLTISEFFALNDDPVGALQRDRVAPATTIDVAAEGWSRVPITATITAVDYLSGVREIDYRVDGGGTWTTFQGDSVQVSVGEEGITSIDYRAGDHAGNVSPSTTAFIRIDRTAPATTVTGIPARWTRQDVTALLSASDNVSGVQRIEYKLEDDERWASYSKPIVISAEGETVLAYRSTDEAGNTSDVQTASVRIDRRGPVTRAVEPVRVRRGHRATLRFIVGDVTPTADVVIKISKGGKLAKKLTLGSRPTGRVLAYVWACDLPRGHYTWRVLATDEAGNRQIRIRTSVLDVI